VGILVNVYEVVPFDVNFGSFAYSAQGIGFGVHHYVGIFVLLFAVSALVFSLKLKNRLLIELSAIGLVLLIGAYGSGITLIYLINNYLFSFTMATSFIFALVVYVSAIFLTPKAPEKKSPET
jgi:FtsH-binding integral membrane protein